MNPGKIKEELVRFCQRSIKQRYDKIKTAIAFVEESLLEESKSTSGDKHHTGRAMLQIEREKLGKQLYEIEQLQTVLKRINIETTSIVKLGSLVYTTSGNYFISLSSGKHIIQQQDYYCVAIDAPIVQLLKGKREDDSYQFQNQTQRIIAVH